MTELETIIEEKESTPFGVLFSMSMAPMTALNTPSAGGMSMGGILDYAHSLSSSFGVESSSIDPFLKSSVPDSSLDYVYTWANSLNAPSTPVSPLFPKTGHSDILSHASLLDSVKSWSIQSTPINPGSFDHSWNFESNVIEKANSWSMPSTPINPSEHLPNFNEKSLHEVYNFEPITPNNMHNPGWGVKQNTFQMPEFKSPGLNLSQFDLPKPETPYIPQFNQGLDNPAFKMPEFNALKLPIPERNWEPTLPPINTFNPLANFVKKENNYENTSQIPQFGHLNTQPVQIGYDFPKLKMQFHLHGPDKDHLTYGKLKSYNNELLGENKNSYELSMLDLSAQNLGFKNIININKKRYYP